MGSAKLVGKVFAVLFFNAVLLVTAWLGLFVYDAFTTYNRIEEVTTLMKRELSINNGFKSEHMQMLNLSAPEGTNYWGYDLQDPFTMSAYDYNINVGTTQTKSQLNGVSTSVYNQNLYQAMLKEAISASNVFDNAYVKSIKGISNGTPRSQIQFHVDYDVYGEEIAVNNVNKDRGDVPESYIVGNKGDWMEVEVVLHTTRSSIMTVLDGGQGLHIANTTEDETGNNGTDIILTYRIPCLAYKVGRMVG